MNHYQSYQLNPLLSPYIDCVWEENFFDQAINRNKNHLIVPDNSIELIFTESTIERQLNGWRGLQRERTHLCGLKTKPQLVKLSHSVLLSIRFKAHGIYRFTKIDASEIVDQSISPSDVFGNSFKDFEAKLFEVHSITERLQIIESYFLHLLIEQEYRQDPLFEAVLSRLELANGQRSIHSLAEDFSISIRTLERKFKRILGISPKKYSRLVRFFQALQIPNFTANSNFSDIVFEHGFYDQMHFIKEVKHFTGMTPTDYLLQDRGIQKPIFSQNPSK